MASPTTDENWTHIAGLLDRSGSMASVDTSRLAEQFNVLVRDTQVDDRKVTATVANFDDRFEIVMRNQDASSFQLKASDIEPRGGTALAPSIGRLIKIIEQDISAMTESIPGTVVFIILSDGQANTYQLDNREDQDAPFEGEKGHTSVCDLVRAKESQDQWKFFWCGTNYDSLKTGPQFGFTPQTCLNFDYSTEGGEAAIRSTSGAINRYQRTPMALDRSSAFDGYTQDERQESINPDADGVDMMSPRSAGAMAATPIKPQRSTAANDDDTPSFSHCQYAGAPWEPYTPEQSQYIDKMMKLMPDGAVLLEGTRFSIRWGALATSAMMHQPPSTNIIQVNIDTGYTRVVRRN